MKARKYLPIFWILFICAVAFSADVTSLEDLYKTGKVRFEREFVLDDGKMPEDVFFENPSTVSCDPEGNIYVVDSGAFNIKKFDAQGNFLKTIGREGQGPGELWRKKYVRTKEYGISIPLIQKGSLFRVFLSKARRRFLIILMPMSSITDHSCC